MSYYDEHDDLDTLLADIDHKHTPDSIREDALRELRKRGVSESQARARRKANYDD